MSWMNSILESLRRLPTAFLWMGCMVGCDVGAAEIFAYVDQDGKLHVSRKQEDQRFLPFDPKKNYLLAARDIGATKTALNHGLRERELRYSGAIKAIANEVGVNANLLHAVIQVESRYDSNAVSHRGAQGMMQLIPATAQRFGVEDAHDPESNIRGGALYLRNLLNRFNDDLELALAAYNAGEGTVEKYNKTIPPYPETEAYVRNVMRIFRDRSRNSEYN